MQNQILIYIEMTEKREFQSTFSHSYPIIYDPGRYFYIMNENEITLLTQIELIYCRGNLSEYISCQMGNWQALTLKFVSFYLFFY